MQNKQHSMISNAQISYLGDTVEYEAEVFDGDEQ